MAETAGIIRRLSRLGRKFGPGLISGASRNDPSSVATYAEAGASIGYAGLWTTLYSYPLLGAIQDISARIGQITGHGVAGNLRTYYSRWLLYPTVFLLAIANVINLGADIGAMGAAMKLIAGGPAIVYSAILTTGSLGLQVGISYEKYVALLKWLTLALLAYAATGLVVSVPWHHALSQFALPRVYLDRAHLTAIVAAFGATINPYLFFWQSSQEVEERAESELEVYRQRSEQIKRIKMDTYSGMAFSNIIAFFIMLTATVTLNRTGVTDIQGAAQAAEALKPVAGPLASTVFALGIVGTGLLALPVLAGSAAYAVGEAMNWPVSLDLKPSEGKGFYGTMVAAALIGLAINFTGINPIRALFWAAIINGVVAVPIMVLLMLMTTDRRVMGSATLSVRLRVMGWTATAVMLATSIGFFLTLR